MKHWKRFAKTALVLVVLVLAGWCWYRMPVRITDRYGEDVRYIELFDGSTGEHAVISDPETLAVIMDDLRDVRVQRSGISAGYMGYSLRITIHYEHFSLFPWTEFILNTDTAVRKDPFFYEVVQGDVDDTFLRSLVGT